MKRSDVALNVGALLMLAFVLYNCVSEKTIGPFHAEQARIEALVQWQQGPKPISCSGARKATVFIGCIYEDGQSSASLMKAFIVHLESSGWRARSLEKDGQQAFCKSGVMLRVSTIAYSRQVAVSHIIYPNLCEQRADVLVPSASSAASNRESEIQQSKSSPAPPHAGEIQK